MRNRKENRVRQDGNEHSGRVFTVANQKGGVGKTTTAVTLAAALGARGKRVLILDLDPHHSATLHLGWYPERVERTAVEAMQNGGLESAVVKTRTPRVDLVPSAIRLGRPIENGLLARGDRALREALEPLLAEYEYVVIDSSPAAGPLLVWALAAADLVIIPVQTDYLALPGVKLLLETIGELDERLRIRVPWRVLPTLHDGRSAAGKRVFKLLRRKFGRALLKTVILVDPKLREASATGETVVTRYPASRGAKEYGRLAGEIVKKVRRQETSPLSPPY